MKPHVLSRLPVKDVELFEKVRRAVTDLPDVDLGEDRTGQKVFLSCHMLARAVGQVFGLKHVDGYFYPNYEHTWVLTPSGNILDVYPVGILGGPFLVDAGMDCPSPARRLYKKKRILRGMPRTPSFRRAINTIAVAIRKTVSKK